MNTLTYLHGAPLTTADIRTENADFVVQEILPFTMTGEGEHHLLYIQKDGLNTVEVAERLSKFAKVHPRDVSYAGQKDKNAITEQWFCVRIPGKETPDWHNLNGERLTVLQAVRHNKKLRIGALSGNRFKLTLRNVVGMDALLERLAQVKQLGVPNYFGEQRFGNDGANIQKARDMFAGKKVKSSNQKAMFLSAMRSLVFNQVVTQRLAQHQLQPLAGDCVMLAGSRSFFTVEQWDDELLGRLTSRDIQLSAPLWGDGELPSASDAAAVELAALAGYESDLAGLEKYDLKQERRPLLLLADNFSWQQLNDDAITLDFVLPAGAFATSVLRELAQYQDMADVRRQQWLAEREQQEGDNA
ncbi:tRNA pseudouridine(13) synthase TruD [Shewanella sp. C32]|uniref:tRNA pseudouridine synthase D n=1 Tax=Shewanella electrica TaxID=515560 RepID=A0ABT2FJB1_9GAMM|nr:tRNA pseudouridine(13) synthase TruD [Shewanella electrica]MCH1925476.1 tRNA pseudouridine(13) synthase TruD [Shewanella electrica]MCS4555301.1 tRNA pseudouridine(13) synthase TruD [Shewanella electrica]